MVEINSNRFLLRELNEADVTERYLSWFDDSVTKSNIVSAMSTKNLTDLRQYVRNRIRRVDVLFLGIFNRKSMLHIGNIKYEPVNTEQGYAIMGLLIGDPDYRGKGVAKEALMASARWLKKNRNINQVILGVDKDNTNAIRAYEKIGFIPAKTEFLPKHPSTMVWDLRMIDHE